MKSALARWTALVALAAAGCIGRGNVEELSPAPGDTTPPSVVSTSPLADASGVALGASMSLTFSEALDPATVSAQTIALFPAQGAAPAVRWDDQALTVRLTPAAPLAAATRYTLAASGVKDLAGNEMPYFELAFTTAAALPLDTTPPYVTSISPDDGMTDVDPNTRIVVGFSEPLAPSSVSLASFSLQPAGASPPSIGYDAGARTVTLTPAGALLAGTLYTLTLSGVRDMAGNALGTVSYSFTTSSSTVDQSAPTIVGMRPADGSNGASVDTDIVITFSEPLAQATVTAAHFALRPATVAPPIYDAASRTVTLIPSAPLLASTQYFVDVSGVEDLAGNAMGATTLSFTTAGGTVDTTPPTVLSMVPGDGSTGASVDTNIVITFSEALDASTVSTATVGVSPGIGAAPLYDATERTITLTPSAALMGSTLYTIDLAGIADLAGNEILPVSLSFTTGTVTTTDTTPPYVVSSDPVDGATRVNLHKRIVLLVSESLDPATVTANTVTLSPTVVGPATVAYNDSARTITITPPTGMTRFFAPVVGLVSNTTYTVELLGVADRAGNRMAFTSRTFTTYRNLEQRFVGWYQGARDSYTQYTWGADGSQLRSTRYKAGPDAQWFNADDSVLDYQGYEFDEVARERRTVQYSGVGSDGQWFTPDDAVLFYNAVSYDADWQQLGVVYYRTAGPNASWFDGDDEVWQYTRDTYSADGRYTGYSFFNGAGTDGTWFNGDDVLLTRQVHSYSAGDRVRTEYFGANGARTSYTDYTFNARAQVETARAYDAAGALTGHELFSYDARGNWTGSNAYDPNDVPKFYYRYAYDANDNITRFTQYSGPGNDGQWFTNDDVLQAELTYETSL